MERIVYQKTLDVHKNGVQFTLSGFETADNLARRIEISLMASGDAIDFPLEKIMAVMYVNVPGTDRPSVIECEIKDNTVVYDVLPIVNEGITEMQLKLIEIEPEGAKKVLATPKFAIEVSKSNMNEEGAVQTTAFTALEDALSRAKAVYDSRFLRMELSSDCMFRAFYADGTVFESDMLRELFHKGESILSQSYARGDTGVRKGEATDNSRHYSKVAKSASIDAEMSKESAQEILDEVRLHGVYTAFTVNFETGEVEYISPRYNFKINTEDGNLEAISQSIILEDEIGLIVTDWLVKNKVDIKELLDKYRDNSAKIDKLETEKADKDNVFTKIETLSDNTRDLLGLEPNVTPDDAFAKVYENSLFSSIEYGYYIGTGTWGEENAITLTFNGTPQVVHVVGGVGPIDGLKLVKPNTTFHVSSYTSDEHTSYITWGENSISWYNQYSPTGEAYKGALTQLNSSGTIYRYYAFVSRRDEYDY